MTLPAFEFDESYDLCTDAAAREVRRRETTVKVRFAHNAGRVQTAEGDVEHAAGAAILTGTHGEQWPVEPIRFDTNYEPVPPTRSGDDGIYRRRPNGALARQLDRPFHVQLRDGRGTLYGVANDWLVQYAPGDLGVVSAQIFAETYEMT